MKKYILIFTALLLSTIPSGCGYNHQAALPENVKTVYVKTVLNKIPVDKIYAYQPGLEMSITNALVKRFRQDGNLQVVKQENADAILETDLILFEQEGLRFTSLESVEEFRLVLSVNFKLKDAKTGKILMEEMNFSGDADYFVSEVRSIGREEAANRASEKLARNMVDRVVEDW